MVLRVLTVVSSWPGSVITATEAGGDLLAVGGMKKSAQDLVGQDQ